MSKDAVRNMVIQEGMDKIMKEQAEAPPGMSVAMSGRSRLAAIIYPVKGIDK